MKFIETEYQNYKGILAFPDHYVNIAVMVDSTCIEFNDQGKKVMKAGTIVGGGVIDGTGAKVKKVNDNSAEGILFSDVDLTFGDSSCAMLIHGFVDINKLPNEPSQAVKDKLKQIHFIKLK